MVLRGFVFQMSNIGNPFVECTSRDMSFKEVFQYWCNPFDCYAIDYHSLPSETHIDVLIMAASVDKRCYAVFEKFLTNCITIDRIVILDYAKTRPMPKSSEYSEYYKLNSYPNVEYIPCNTDGYDCEYISKADFSSSSKVFIDITSISVPDIFRIFYVFKEFLA